MLTTLTVNIYYFKCTLLDMSGFCDSTYATDLLDHSLSRGDLVHLNHRGTRKLAIIIKDNIYLKYNSGRGSHINSKKPYSVALREGRGLVPPDSS